MPGSMEERIEQYLGDLKCVLWSQSFDLSEGHDRRRAKEFVLDLLIDLGVTYEMLEEDR